MKDIVIKLKTGNTEKTIKCPSGTPAKDLVSHLGGLASPLAAFKANNKVIPLSYPLDVDAVLEPVLLDSSDGSAIYRRSLAFLLAQAARKLFPDKSLYVGHSLGHGYYYTFTEGRALSREAVKSLENEMKALVKENIPISYRFMGYAEAQEHFTKNHQNDTVLLLECQSESKVLVNECKDFTDLFIAPLVPETGLLDCFELMPYKEGFLLRFPATGQGGYIEPFEDSPKIFEVYREYKKWGRIIGVHAVGRLNQMISVRGAIKDYIRIAEAFQQKKLDEIADRIYGRKDKIKAVLIAGPSSSGKTTTAKRLGVALMVMGLKPIAISLDDYYRGTENTPLDEEGKPDFECLEALDVPYLNRQLLDAMNGKEITLPVFDFKAGRRKESGGRSILMDRRTILVIEGIHGLNDALTPQIPKETKFRLYVSALTQLNLDDHNRVPTSDNRLLRRLVRDNQFRGSSAARTLQMWPSVHRGERKHIFPFQNSADAAFNSALDYELSVLKFYAEPLLRSVKPWMPEYAEAVRLLSFLKNFAPIPPQYVPGYSILREFIGDSEFKY
jgi:uridine kinase